MKTRQLVALGAVLAVVLVFVAVVGSRVPLKAVLAQDEPAQVEPAARELTQDALAQTRPWSSVGAACAPDDDSPYTRYESQPSYGYVEHATGVTGDLYFVCNVTTPIDSYPGEPDWNTMYLTYKDPDASGYVQATLYRKRLTTGGVASLGSLTSTDGTGVRESSILVSGFDFDTYAYFVRIRMNRSTTTSDQEFHIVRLQFVLW